MLVADRAIGPAAVHHHRFARLLHPLHRLQRRLVVEQSVDVQVTSRGDVRPVQLFRPERLPGAAAHPGKDAFARLFVHIDQHHLVLRPLAPHEVAQVDAALDKGAQLELGRFVRTCGADKAGPGSQPGCGDHRCAN